MLQKLFSGANTIATTSDFHALIVTIQQDYVGRLIRPFNLVFHTSMVWLMLESIDW